MGLSVVMLEKDRRGACDGGSMVLASLSPSRTSYGPKNGPVWIGSGSAPQDLRLERFRFIAKEFIRISGMTHVNGRIERWHKSPQENAFGRGRRAAAQPIGFVSPAAMAVGRQAEIQAEIHAARYRKLQEARL